MDKNLPPDSWEALKLGASTYTPAAAKRFLEAVAMELHAAVGGTWEAHLNPMFHYMCGGVIQRETGVHIVFSEGKADKVAIDCYHKDRHEISAAPGSPEIGTSRKKSPAAIAKDISARGMYTDAVAWKQKIDELVSEHRDRAGALVAFRRHLASEGFMHHENSTSAVVGESHVQAYFHEHDSVRLTIDCTRGKMLKILKELRGDK